MTLTSIAGGLHDGARDLPQLTSDLLAINRALCDPPLPAREVRSIARSIHKRPVCKTSPAHVGEEVRAALGLILDEIDAARAKGYWRGRAGLTDLSVLMALIRLGLEYGRLIPAGVRVGVSTRKAALEAEVSHRTVISSLARLRNPEKRPRKDSAEPWLSRDDQGRAPLEAGAIVLRAGGRFSHTFTTHPEGKVLRLSRGSVLSTLRHNYGDVTRTGARRASAACLSPRKERKPCREPALTTSN